MSCGTRRHALVRCTHLVSARHLSSSISISSRNDFRACAGEGGVRQSSGAALVALAVLSTRLEEKLVVKMAAGLDRPLRTRNVVL